MNTSLSPKMEDRGKGAHCGGVQSSYVQISMLPPLKDLYLLHEHDNDATTRSTSSELVIRTPHIGASRKAHHARSVNQAVLRWPRNGIDRNRAPASSGGDVPYYSPVVP